MMEMGINVGLGTDSAASNNNLNMMQDLALFALLYKGSTGDPTVITPAQALRAATLNGALAQGRTDSGVIREGARADLVVLDIDQPWMTPTIDLLTNVIYSAQGSDVCLTMVDGKVLYRDGEYTTIDIEKVKYETQKETDAILAQL